MGCNYLWRQRHARILACPREITALRFAGNRGANRSRSSFIGKKGGNSKQKVLSAMSSRAPGATSFAAEQSTAPMAGRTHSSRVNQISPMFHQPRIFTQDQVLPFIFRRLIIHTRTSGFQEHLWKSLPPFARAIAVACHIGCKCRICRMATIEPVATIGGARVKFAFPSFLPIRGTHDCRSEAAISRCHLHSLRSSV